MKAQRVIQTSFKLPEAFRDIAASVCGQGPHAVGGWKRGRTIISAFGKPLEDLTDKELRLAIATKNFIARSS